MGQPFSLDSAAEYILLIKPSYPPSNYDGRHRVSNQNPSNSGSDLHLSLSVAVAVTAVLRLVLEAAQVNIAPWSALVTEPYRRLDLVRGPDNVAAGNNLSDPRGPEAVSAAWIMKPHSSPGIIFT